MGKLEVGDVFPSLDLQAASGGASTEAARPQTLEARRRNGSNCDMELSISRLHEGRFEFLVLVGRDVTHRRAITEQQHENERKLIHLAQHDSLTGLPNRLYMRTHLPQMLQELSGGERGMVLIYLDIDHFKNLNDSRGHAFGDRLLQLVARRLRASVAEHDAVIRMGGDEFVIALTMPPRRDTVDGVAQRLSAAVAEPLYSDGEELVLTASMGIAMYPDDGLDLDTLLRHADIALYLSKDAGRNCHRYFQANMQVRVSEDVALEQAMRHALDSEQFFVEYQPVVDLATNRVSSVEALLRWRHPELGLVPPARFIPVAERSGMIERLGELALSSVLWQLRAWQTSRLPRLPVAVNVSVLQLERGDFLATVRKHLAATGVEAHWLHFEITESALLSEQDRIAGTLQELRSLGCKVLIDDFGTGYSALSHLHRLPVDGLKIDRSFVVEMGRNQGQSPVIASIVNMARELKLAVVVEGVETADQLMMLRGLRAPAAQGYFFSRPLSVEKCSDLLLQLDQPRSLGESTTDRVLRGSEFDLAS